MAPSGEACLVRYPDGRVRVSSIYGSPQSVDAADVDRYIAAHDWTRINRSFATWEALQIYRNRHATPPAESIPQIADYDAAEIREVLEEISTAENAEERVSARLLLIDILAQASAVRSDDDLYRAVVSRLRELNHPLPQRTSARSRDDLEVAMQRYAAA